MSLSITSSVSSRSAARGLVPLCAAVGAYLFYLSAGEILLRDSDTMWQIRVGQWILEHGAMPTSDVFSFTRFGEPWISSSWLSQVMYALVYGGDWAGPVILSSMAIGATVAIFLHLLSPYFDPARALLIAALALLLSTIHFLARPHVLALPVLLAFIGGLLAAADRRTSPSWWLLPLMTLWANLHGGFVLGLALIGPIGLEAVWNAGPGRRRQLVVRWGLFGLAALAASCVTPYGWNSLLGATKILSLGKLLTLIGEWKPADFSKPSFFEATLLGLIGLICYRRLTLSVPRILLLLGLIWMALSHVRNIEVFAFIAPLVLAKPIAEQWATTGAAAARFGETRAFPVVTMLAVIAMVIGAWVTTAMFVAQHQFKFLPMFSPVAAVDVLQQHKAQRVFQHGAVRRLHGEPRHEGVHRRPRRALWRAIRARLLRCARCPRRRPAAGPARQIPDRCHAAELGLAGRQRTGSSEGLEAAVQGRHRRDPCALGRDQGRRGGGSEHELTDAA
ncbi:hypothetical protein ACVJF0_007166 [Bradyrhizobium elkanii]